MWRHFFPGFVTEPLGSWFLNKTIFSGNWILLLSEWMNRFPKSEANPLVSSLAQAVFKPKNYASK